MPRKITATTTYGPFPITALEAVVIVDANAGTVKVETLLDDSDSENLVWVDNVTYSADGTNYLKVAGQTVRVSVTGSAEFAFIKP